MSKNLKEFRVQDGSVVHTVIVSSGSVSVTSWAPLTLAHEDLHKFAPKVQDILARALSAATDVRHTVEARICNVCGVATNEWYVRGNGTFCREH